MDILETLAFIGMVLLGILGVGLIATCVVFVFKLLVWAVHL